ncbi:MAG: hypothetical protein QOC89_3926 [Paraburkholderia sp.]|nr:hypothetical protein [Paraburkholderia sp.]
MSDARPAWAAIPGTIAYPPTKRWIRVTDTKRAFAIDRAHHASLPDARDSPTHAPHGQSQNRATAYATTVCDGTPAVA